MTKQNLQNGIRIGNFYLDCTFLQSIEVKD
jgi:hypothetical protein